MRCEPALRDAVLARLADDDTLEIVQRMTFPTLYACPSAVAADVDACAGLCESLQPLGAA